MLSSPRAPSGKQLCPGVPCVDGRCVLQMGGSDQWGNMVNGVDLGRRVEQAELFALTAPLITTSDGKKMGKSASGAVWLNADKLPEYDYWQVKATSAHTELRNMLHSQVALYMVPFRCFARVLPQKYFVAHPPPIAYPGSSSRGDSFGEIPTMPMSCAS